MTETLFTRKVSYLANADDITGMCASETQATFCGRSRQPFGREPGGRRMWWWVVDTACDNLPDPGKGFPVHNLSLDLPCGQVKVETRFSPFNAIPTPYV